MHYVYYLILIPVLYIIIKSIDSYFNKFDKTKNVSRFGDENKCPISPFDSPVWNEFLVVSTFISNPNWMIKCIHCGCLIHIRMAGSQKKDELLFEEKAVERLTLHLNKCERYKESMKT